ncbi:MAG: xanthine dehydrogenase family protein subunit M [Proteobacteria bacterium]|nr:xanthine dehydrogenase family protein subunit M [Pseudomonadota bacterium]
MKPAPFDYAAPRTLDEAIDLLGRHGEDARPLAGGQSLMPMLALRLSRPSLLVDLNRVESLSGIRIDDDELRIGAMTRQAEALESAEIRRHVPLLAQALAEVGHPPTRARGTIGGSLAHADPAAELPAVIVALGAKLVIRGATGERVLRAEEFFRGMFETDVKAGELLVEIRIPIQAQGSAFLEIALRKGDFAIVSVAASIALGPDQRCVAATLVLGGVGPMPVRCADSERRLIGHTPDAAAISAAAEAIPIDRVELGSRSASRGYRRRVAPVLVKRALAAAAGAAGAAP